MLEIKTFQSISADTLQSIDLGNGESVRMRIVNNSRTDFFTLSIADQNDHAIDGIKIVPNWLLLDQFKAFSDLTGDFIVLKVDEEAGDEITYDNFGIGYTLNYLTAEEVQYWRDANGL
ncbi:MAG: phage baseplate plug family protein [Candidatus Hodarchaeales archaeon]|jgi:hypothetical protein